MRFTASHGFAEVDTWPVDKAGVDSDRAGNHKFGPVSAVQPRQPRAVHGRLPSAHRAGVVHYSPIRWTCPTKKIWSWGGDADGLDWRKALSDDESAYVEVQAGLFRNQETYAFLEPRRSRSASASTGCPCARSAAITRANPDARASTAPRPAADRSTSRSGST